MVCIVHTVTLGTQLAIAANDKWNQIAPAQTHGTGLSEDGVPREKSFSSLLCYLESLKNSPWKVVKPGNFPNN